MVKGRFFVLEGYRKCTRILVVAEWLRVGELTESRIKRYETTCSFRVKPTVGIILLGNQSKTTLTCYTWLCGRNGVKEWLQLLKDLCCELRRNGNT